MIVAPQPEAVEAGAAMLAAGGNALDAALACALTQGVVDPMMCGIGGIATLQVLDPRTGTHRVWNGLGTCPAAATPDMWESIFEGECADGFGYRVAAGERAGRAGHHHAGRAAGFRRRACGAMAARPGRRCSRPRSASPRPAGPSARMSTPCSPWTRPPGAGCPTRRSCASPRRARRCTAGPTARRSGWAMRCATRRWRRRSPHRRRRRREFYPGGIARDIAAAVDAAAGCSRPPTSRGSAPRLRAAARALSRLHSRALPPPPAGGIVVGEMLRILERFDLAALGHNSARLHPAGGGGDEVRGLDKEAHVGDPAFRTRRSPSAVRRLCRCLRRPHPRRRAAPAWRGRRATQGHHDLSCVDADGMFVSHHAYAGDAVGRDPAGDRLHAERRDELV